MSEQDAELSVRQHLRHTCDLPVQIVVAPASAEAVRPLKVTAGGGFSGRLVDCSLGGIGLQVSLFLPVSCRVTVVLAQPGVPPLETTARIQRVTMVDRRPTYYLGTSFEHARPEDEVNVSRFLDWLKEHATQSVVEKKSA